MRLGEIMTRGRADLAQVARLLNVHEDKVSEWLRDDNMPAHSRAALLEGLGLSEEDLGGEPIKPAAVDLFNQRSFDTEIGLASNPLVDLKSLETMLYEYGPAKPSTGMKYAALVFPNGKNIIAVGPGEEKVAAIISENLGSASFVSLMSILLKLNCIAGHAVHVPFHRETLTYVVSVYGKWVPDAKLFSFTESIVSIAPRLIFRTELVEEPLLKFESRLRAYVKSL